MKTFLGIHLLSSIVNLPAFRLYWNNITWYPPISDVMAPNRFERIRSNLYFVDYSSMSPQDDPNHDKLFKIRLFIVSICRYFRKIPAEERSAVDEIMIPFKRHSFMKKYIHNKPHKWGLKMFATASKSGIAHDFEIYVGKKTIPESKNRLGISGDIVIRLAECLPKFCNYKLCFDNCSCLMVSFEN